MAGFARKSGAVPRAVTRYGSCMRKNTWRRGRPHTDRPMSAAERMRRMRAIRKALGFKAVVRWVPRKKRPRSPPSLDLRLLEARSLALHVVAARKIEADPRLLEALHRRLSQWCKRNSGVPGEARRAWRKLLRLPWPEMAARMTEQSEAGLRLRSFTPIADVLKPRERRLVYDAFRPKESPCQPSS